MFVLIISLFKSDWSIIRFLCLQLTLFWVFSIYKTKSTKTPPKILRSYSNYSGRRSPLNGTVNACSCTKLASDTVLYSKFKWCVKMRSYIAVQEFQSSFLIPTRNPDEELWGVLRSPLAACYCSKLHIISSFTFNEVTPYTGNMVRCTWNRLKKNFSIFIPWIHVLKYTGIFTRHKLSFFATGDVRLGV